MECKYCEQRDITSFGSDVFDHPDYKFFCSREVFKKEIIPAFDCKECKTKSQLESILKNVKDGKTEIGCPSYEDGHDCMFFGRQSEYGKCYKDDFYNCWLWKRSL